MPTATMKKGYAGKTSGNAVAAWVVAIVLAIVLLGVYYYPDNDDCLFWEIHWTDNNGDYGGKEEVTTPDFEDANRLKEAFDRQHRGYRRYYVKCGEWKDENDIGTR